MEAAKEGERCQCSRQVSVNELCRYYGMRYHHVIVQASKLIAQHPHLLSLLFDADQFRAKKCFYAQVNMYE